MHVLRRRAVALSLSVAAALGGGIALQQRRAAAAARGRILRQSLAGLADACSRREALARESESFEAAEAHLNSLLSLCESAEAARDELPVGALPEIGPDRLAAAYERAHARAAGHAELRRRLHNLEERFDDRFRERLLARAHAQ